MLDATVTFKAVSCRILITSWPATLGDNYSNGLRFPSVCLSVCVSHANIFETKRYRAIVTIQFKYEIEVPCSENVIRFATGSTVPTICPSETKRRVFHGRNFGSRGPAIVSFHPGRYLVYTVMILYLCFNHFVSK